MTCGRSLHELGFLFLLGGRALGCCSVEEQAGEAYASRLWSYSWAPNGALGGPGLPLLSTLPSSESVSPFPKAGIG